MAEKKWKVSNLLAKSALTLLAIVAVLPSVAEAGCDFPKNYPDPIKIANKKVDEGQKQSSYLRIYEFPDRIEVHGKHSNGHQSSGELHGVNGSGGGVQEKCAGEKQLLTPPFVPR